MKVGIIDGRPVLHEAGGAFFARSSKAFQPELGIASLLDALPELQPGERVEGPLTWEAPFPRPSQVFAVGLNYRKHAHEMGLQIPTTPMVFTKFPSSIGRPETNVNLPGPTTDWEAELVVVIGHTVRSLSLATALESVAGYMVGQDYSERTVQMSNTPAQFSLGKSFENFTIAGPYLTTVDEIPDPQKLTISCAVNGELMQSETTQDMAFSIAEILVYISSVCELRAGDLIFTGSPAGVGQGQIPPRFLVGGDEVTTSISGLGSISNRFIGDAR